MSSVICTLFEGHYHFGVAALTNSLHNQGFKGSIYVGFRGQLPPWTSQAKEDLSLTWSGSRTLIIRDDLRLHFLPLNTTYHLTNYKPDFMLSLLEGPAQNATSIFYFDPDIVVSAPWNNFEEWASCGVALCEDINSPLSENHPKRIAWRKYFKKNNLHLKYKKSIYANGGFIGIRKEHFGFLTTWQNLQILMAPEIGGLNRSALVGTPLLKKAYGPFAPFDKTDQDALNASVEAWDGEVSFLGKEGMGFKNGFAIMPHALGHPKPWKWKPVAQALAGRPPRHVDKKYWKFANGIIITRSANLVKYRKFCINVAALIGRFYKKN